MPQCHRLVLIAAMALVGCQSTQQAVQEAGTRVMGSSPGVEAPMRAIGGTSAAMGTVKFLDRNDGVLVMFTATNLLPGTYRLALHRDPNCSSPNAFSAGPPWAPTGSKVEAGRVFPEFRTSSEGDASQTFRVPGLRTEGPEGLYGRSIVLHWGSSVDQAMPGVPNNRVLCGVVGPVRSFFN